MSNYVQSTNFATKDALPSGDPLKIVKGTEINTEFNNIAVAVATKADINQNSTGTAGSLAATNWTVLQSGTSLLFRYNGSNRMSLDSSGNLTVIGNVTAYGTL